MKCGFLGQVYKLYIAIKRSKFNLGIINIYFCILKKYVFVTFVIFVVIYVRECGFFLLRSRDVRVLLRFFGSK